MIKKICQDIELNMKKCLELFRISINKFRIGRISINILDEIKIPYHRNSFLPLKNISNITLKNANTLSITVFDKKLIPEIKKSILKSDLGVNPYSNGSIIYVSFPEISKERRIEIIKIIKSSSEDSKISIRNIRRNYNNLIKKNFKKKIINKDEEYKLYNEIDKLTNIYVKHINNLFLQKHKEIIQ